MQIEQLGVLADLFRGYQAEVKELANIIERQSTDDSSKQLVLLSEGRGLPKPSQLVEGHVTTV